MARTKTKSPTGARKRQSPVDEWDDIEYLRWKVFVALFSRAEYRSGLSHGDVAEREMVIRLRPNGPASSLVVEFEPWRLACAMVDAAVDRWSAGAYSGPESDTRGARLAFVARHAERAALAYADSIACMAAAASEACARATMEAASEELEATTLPLAPLWGGGLHVGAKRGPAPKKAVRDEIKAELARAVDAVLTPLDPRSGNQLVPWDRYAEEVRLAREIFDSVGDTFSRLKRAKASKDDRAITAILREAIAPEHRAIARDILSTPKLKQSVPRNLRLLFAARVSGLHSKLPATVSIRTIDERLKTAGTVPEEKHRT